MRYIATIGFFDGVHCGHLFLIRQLIERAGQAHLASMLITFGDHPRLTLEGQMPDLLLTREEREQRLKATGVSQVVEFNFPIVQNMTAEEFMHILHNQCEVDTLLMGYDHRFGSDHLADLADYQAAGLRAGIRIEQIAPLPSTLCNLSPISSTKIRRALQEGRITDANAMLGYPYFLTGTVVHGKHIGSQLGFPTANLAIPAHKLIPQAGVYIARLTLSPTHRLTDSPIHPLPPLPPSPCLVNIGTNPTMADNNQLTVEVHIPDFQGDLYRQQLTVELIRYLRPEKRFDNMDQLKRQIRLDLQQLTN